MKSQGRGKTLPAEAGSLMAPQKGTRDLIPGAYEYVTSQGNAALQMRSRILRGEPILDYGGGHDVITKVFKQRETRGPESEGWETLLLALKTQEGATSGGMQVACGSWGSRDGDSPESLQKGCCSADPLISACRMDGWTPGSRPTAPCVSWPPSVQSPVTAATGNQSAGPPPFAPVNTHITFRLWTHAF